MDQKSESGARGFSSRLWSIVAAVLTAGLVLSLIVMLYALVRGFLRRLHG